MDAHQRRIKRRRALRGQNGDEIDRFVEWMRSGAGTPCVYSMDWGGPAGNQRYWSVTAGVPAAKFTRETVLRLMGCGRKQPPGGPNG